MVWIGARGREKLEEELAGKRSPFAISSRVGGEAVPNESSTKRTKFLRDPGPWEHVVSRRDPKRGAFLLCAAAIVPLGACSGSGGGGGTTAATLTQTLPPGTVVHPGQLVE